MTELEQSFDAKIRAALPECHRLGYHPHDFEGMLANSTAVKLAERLVKSGELQTGLKKLAQLDRLDLSVESIMLEPEFEALFKSSVRDAARWRLEQVRAEK
jgi:hypothetical protein